MSLSFLLPLIVCAAVIVGLTLALRNLAFAESSLPVTAEWINELSTDRYRPMMRLLDSADLRFLRSQPGYTRRMEVRLRAQRCQIFRGYLRCLNMDFQRVATALKVVMSQSTTDRPDLAAALIHHQLQFALGMQMVRGRLLLYQFGIGGVDVRSLLGNFDFMRVELGILVPQAVESCA